MPFFLSVSTFNKQIRERLNNKKNPQVMQLNGTARLKFNGGHLDRDNVHLLNLLFVTAVGISLRLSTTTFSPGLSL